MTSRVLVVDDERSILDVVRYTLEQAGFTVDVASTAESARSKATGDAMT